MAKSDEMKPMPQAPAQPKKKQKPEPDADDKPKKDLSGPQKAAMRHKDDKDGDEPMHPAKAVFKAISKAPKYQGK